jgi:hypothetical protein
MNGYNSNEFQVDTPEDTPFFFYTNPVVGVDSQEYFEIKLHDLVSQIKDRIDYFIKQMRKNPQIQWYSHKIAVLNATKNYLYDNIEIDTLEDYKRVYPKWDKAVGVSNTKNLVIEAMLFKKRLEQQKQRTS